MGKAKEKVEYFLRIRTNSEGVFADAWICRRTGPCHHGVLWGSVHPSLVEEIAQALGLPVEREHTEFTNVTPIKTKDTLPVAQQAELFAD